MRNRLIASLIALGLAAAPAFASGDRQETSPITRWMPVQQVLAKIESAGFRDILEIEREDGYYEVKAVNSDGRRVKLHVHPETGEIVDRRLRDSSRHRDSSRRMKNASQSDLPCERGACGDGSVALKAAATSSPK